MDDKKTPKADPKTLHNDNEAPTRESRPKKGKRGERSSTSFLVRFWEEPGGEQEDAIGALRGYVRNLRTGQERYLGTAEQLGDHIRKQLAREGKTVEIEAVGPESDVEGDPPEES